MINVSAASVVTAHCDPNNRRSVNCHPAQPRIARYKLSDAFFIVTLGNLQAFDSLPELKRRVVIVDRKFSSNDLATHLVFTTLEASLSCRAKSRHPAKLPVVCRHRTPRLRSE